MRAQDYRLPEGVIEQVWSAAGKPAPRFRSDGKASVRCVFPGRHKHEDRDASAWIDRKANIYGCHCLDRPLIAKQLAEQLGVDWVAIRDQAFPSLPLGCPASASKGEMVTNKGPTIDEIKRSLSVARQYTQSAESKHDPARQYLHKRGLHEALDAGSAALLPVDGKDLPDALAFQARRGFRIAAPTYGLTTGEMTALVLRNLAEADRGQDRIRACGATSGTAFCSEAALRLIRGEDGAPQKVLLLEGMTDYLACSMSLPSSDWAVVGFPGVGTATTFFASGNGSSPAPWIDGRTFYLAFDADEAGQRAAERIISGLGAHPGVKLHQVRWPGDLKDAALVLERKGPAALLEAVEKAEAARIAMSVGRYELAGQGRSEEGSDNKTTQGELITELCESAVVEFFQDERGTPHVVTPVEMHNELWPTSAERFRVWMAKTYRDRYGKPPGREAMYQARDQVDAMCYEKPRRTLYNRVGKHKGRIIYDLSDDEWRGVVVSEAGWEISGLPPVFRRLKHQLPQVEPTCRGDARKLLEFCNISEDDQCLFLVSVASWLVPDIPHPIIVLHGEPGSGKSTTARVVKQLIDPSAAQSLRAPRDEESADHVLFNHWVASFDNVSHISDWFSDMLCRAVTGGASSQRKLYTNEEDIPRAYRRCVLINGIGNPAVRADLLDRAVVIETEPLSAVVNEEEFSARWIVALPEILGGLLDSLAKAMGDVDTVRRPDLPRMADFVRWGLVLAPALGFSGDQFHAAYMAALDAKWLDAVTNDAFADAVLGVVRETEEGRWEGTARELLEALPERLKASRAKNWTPSTVGREISRLAPALRKLGLSVEKQHSKQGRRIVLILREGVQSGDETVVSF